LFFEGPRAGPADIDHPANADVDSDRCRPDDIDVGITGVDAEPEAGGQCNGRARETAEYVHLRLPGQQEHELDGRRIDRDLNRNRDRCRTRCDAEIDAKSDADSAFDQNVDGLVLNAGLNAESARQRIDNPMAWRVRRADAHKESDIERQYVEGRADVEGDVIDGSRPERNRGYVEVVRDGKRAAGEMNMEPGSFVAVARIGNRPVAARAQHTRDIFEHCEERGQRAQRAVEYHLQIRERRC